MGPGDDGIIVSEPRLAEDDERRIQVSKKELEVFRVVVDNQSEGVVR